MKRAPVLAGGPVTTLDVFDAEGTYWGEVTVAGDVDVLEVGNDYLLGTMADSLDVPYVVMFSLSR